MKYNILIITLWIFTIGLLLLLGLLLSRIPSFSFPSQIGAVVILVTLFIGSAAIAKLFSEIFYNLKFTLTFAVILSLASIILSYKVYTPKLTITVPKGFTGRITLIRSNLSKNVLNVDSNGIGYIRNRNFKRFDMNPVVLEVDGTDISSRTVGYIPSEFWVDTVIRAHPELNDQRMLKVSYVHFEVVPIGQEGRRHDYGIDLTGLVDTAKLYRAD